MKLTSLLMAGFTILIVSEAKAFPIPGYPDDITITTPSSTVVTLHESTNLNLFPEGYGYSSNDSQWFVFNDGTDWYAQNAADTIHAYTFLADDNTFPELVNAIWQEHPDTGNGDFPSVRPAEGETSIPEPASLCILSLPLLALLRRRR